MAPDLIAGASTALSLALIGACLIRLLRPRPTPVFLAVRRDGKLVEVPGDQLTPPDPSRPAR